MSEEKSKMDHILVCGPVRPNLALSHSWHWLIIQTGILKCNHSPLTLLHLWHALIKPDPQVGKITPVFWSSSSTLSLPSHLQPIVVKGKRASCLPLDLCRRTSRSAHWASLDWSSLTLPHTRLLPSPLPSHTERGVRASLYPSWSETTQSSKKRGHPAAQDAPDWSLWAFLLDYFSVRFYFLLFGAEVLKV